MSSPEIHGDGSSLSIEETNKLRLKLGLPPLIDESSNNDDKAEGEKKDYVHQPASNIGDKKLQEKQRNKLKEHREARELRMKLAEVPSLTDLGTPLLSIEEIAERAEKARQRKEQELEEEEDEEEEEPQQQQQQPYTERDLSGMAVEHNPARFNSFMPTILTLKDKNVLDEDDDVLENVNIVDYEKSEQNVKNKKMGLHYNPDQYSADDNDYNNPPSLLQKYDEEKKSRFIIDNRGKYDLSEELQAEKINAKLLGRKISLPETELKVASDYYTTEELRQRLRTKKTRKATSIRQTKSTRPSSKHPLQSEDIKSKKEEGELIEEETNQNETKSSSKHEKNNKIKYERSELIKSLANDNKAEHDEEEEEEEDFRASLVYSEIKPMTTTMLDPRLRGQLAAMKKPQKKIMPIDEIINNSLKNDEKAPAAPVGLVLSASSASNDQIFSKLKAQQESAAMKASYVKEDSSKVTVVPAVLPGVASSSKTKVENMIMDINNDSNNGDDDDEERTQQPPSSGWQPEDKVMSAPRQQERKRNIRQAPSSPPPKKELKLTDGVLGDEVVLNKGVFSALLLARNKGYLEQPKEETILSNPRSSILKAQNYYEEKIRYDDIDSKGLGRRERHSGPLSTFQDKKDFNPEIKLEYPDEYGRNQEPKEAFRSLSHRFHGKSSGKIKCEKRIKSYVKEMESGALVGDVAMKSVDKQYSKMKEDKKFCVPLSGKNAIIPSSLAKKTQMKDNKKK